MIDGLYRRPPRPALIRILCIACLVAIGWLSLYPLTGWRLRQPSPFAFLAHGLPRFHTQGDLVANVAAYLVFTMLLTVGWFRAHRAWVSPLLAVLIGTLMSFGFESLQSYLPNRVPSMLDVYGNVGGAVLGALLGLTVGLLRARSLQAPGQVSAAWYEQGPTIGWILVVIWVVSQLPVQRLLFSTGHLPSMLADRLPGLQDLLLLLPTDTSPEALRSTLETITIAVMVAVLGVLIMDLVRSVSARFIWLLVLLTSAYGLRMLSVIQGGPALPPLAWLTSAAQAGLLVASLAIYLIGAFRRRTRMIIGFVLTLVGIVLVNLSPADPFFQASAARIRPAFGPAITPGLHSLLGLFTIGWPFAMLVYFAARTLVLRRTRQPR